MRKKTVLVPTRNTMNSGELPKAAVTLAAAPWDTVEVEAVHIAPEPPMRRTIRAPDIEPLFDRSRAW